MEYNTQREKLKITDYGRIVDKMIAYAKTIEDREERNAFAKNIISTMEHVNPKVKERSDYQQILWNHMMFMADYELDVDAPCKIVHEELTQMNPHPIQMRDSKITYRHYGRALEDMIKAVADMPESDDRNALTQQIAHTMKRQYLQWNRDSVDDELIREQLTELSGGKLKLPADFQFRDTSIYLDAMAAVAARKEALSKKKKKKKKKNNNSDNKN